MLLLILAAVAGYAWLQSDSGRHWFEAKLSSASDGQVHIVGLSGALPFHAEVRQVILSDPAGRWLTADAVQVAIQPAALLRLKVEVELARAARIELTRLPHQPQKGQGSPGLPSLPKLPFSLQIDHLSAPEIVVAQEVFGKEAHFSLNASGGLRPELAQALLTIERLDAAGKATANLHFDREGLMLAADLADPTGLVGRILGAVGDVPVVLHASGQGPLRNWSGIIEASVADARSRVAVRVDQEDWTVSGTLDPRPLLQPRIARASCRSR